jgi:hypothetical protein
MCSWVRLQCLWLAAFLPAFAADWPRLLGPALDGTSAETNLIERIPADGPPMVWDREVGTGYAAPSVAGGRLFLFHRVGAEELLEAWDAVTAKPLWKHSQPTRYRDPYGYNDGPRCAPLVAGGRVFTFGAEGLLTCVDAATGSRLWQRNTAKEFEVPEAWEVALRPWVAVQEGPFTVEDAMRDGLGIVAERWELGVKEPFALLPSAM